MRLNWIIDFDANDEMKKLCVDMEYFLRSKITKFLIANWDDMFEDFENLVFDIDLITKEITISEKSPPHLAAIIESKFNAEFNQEQLIVDKVNKDYAQGIG